MIQRSNMELRYNKSMPREISFEEIVKECFDRVEFRAAVASGVHPDMKGLGGIETEFKKQRRLFLKELEDEIQETWNEKKLSFTRR